MSMNAEELELKERLKLIESMIGEGRRTTESWGWTFVLWGVAYYVAILWTAFGHSHWAWPVTMLSACALTAAISVWKKGRQPRTTMNRAIASMWIAMGITMLLLFPALGFSGRMDQHIMIAVVSGMLGTTNAASSMALRWKMQFACAVVWWATAVYACFGASKPLTVAFLGAIFFCQIVFGIYGMVAQRRDNRGEARNA